MDYIKLKKSVFVGIMVAVASFTGIETVDLYQTSLNKSSSYNNSQLSKENEDRIQELEWRFDNAQGNKVSGSRLCVCVAEDNNLIPDENTLRRKFCPIVCETSDAIRQCEEINQGYQCG
ncbi:hypothetical protein [Vibrio parahaemolyticus]|uniref:hypothetical protein n=2 Tax=Vibrio parahaemolyticus TaxID=670 RepID=UPI000470B036|nr:hypothetical protein [Vibrio parahaemolyticus]MBE5142862.1 hypothetical protein [Vibrio parahaemolyticus]ODZ95955.1 hypothetical protein BBM50_00595 [Vibrio parahaemolyticus]OEA02095.1 hypothetical protein BBM51_11485 [Vibrio parahaemolyticus]